jgi:hypothetical protein
VENGELNQSLLSQYLFGNAAGEAGVMATPYYRFWLMPTWQSAQHAMLLELEGTGGAGLLRCSCVLDATRVQCGVFPTVGHGKFGICPA